MRFQLLRQGTEPSFAGYTRYQKIKTATLWRFLYVESIGYSQKPPQRGGFDFLTECAPSRYSDLPMSWKMWWSKTTPLEAVKYLKTAGGFACQMAFISQLLTVVARNERRVSLPSHDREGVVSGSHRRRNSFGKYFSSAVKGFTTARPHPISHV